MADRSPIDRGADLFNSLSRRVGIGIIKVVHEEGPISFSGSMKALNIESSSLGFHLKQLEACLIREENGNYDLSEKGRTALKVLHPLNIVNLKQDNKPEVKKLSETPEGLQWLVREVLRVRAQPGNWGIGLGAFIAFVGLIMLVWNPTSSVLVVAVGLLAVCVGIWFNHEETGSLLKFIEERYRKS